ncbi:LemA family protein [Niveibacterium terrae]|uniref:LemA family protein n=1 Tax=Niveibacterium terrae TaxID=3373598 RepID=UPI003A8FE2E0
MPGVLLAGLGLLLLAIILLCWQGITSYNQLQAGDEWVTASWSQVLNQYRRRADLIPNAIALTRSYAKHETAIFTELAKARQLAVGFAAPDGRDPRAVEQYRLAQAGLTQQLGRLLALVEKYPELKADRIFQDLLVQLEGTENRIAYARQRYIDSVTRYNTEIRQFPGNLIAQACGLRARPNFSDSDAAGIAKAPRLDAK